MTDAAANRLAEMTDEDLIRVHARLDENDPTHVSVVEAHHLTTVEMARRGLDHGHHADDWTMTVVEVESADVDGPDDIGAPEGMDKAWADTLADGGTVTILLTVDGYVLKADGPTVSDVHVDTIMGGPKKRKKYKSGPLVDADEDMEKRIIRRAGKWVVQSHDGSRDLGTYDTEQEAEDRLEQVERYAKADGYQIPSDVQAAAKKALRWIADGFAGDGFTSVGRGRARQLADGGTVGRETLVKMRAYFARHIIDKDAEGWGDQSNPTPGMVAWYAWGGNPGRAWANRVLGDVEKAYDPDGDSEEEYLSTLDDATLAWYGDIGFLIDNAADVDGFMEKAGNPEPLRDYWRGGGKGKINWGAGGDFTACVAAVSKYMTDEQAKGYCAIRHREVNGFWPGDKRNKPAKKSAGPDDISGVFTLPDGSTYTFFGDSLEKKMSRSEAARVAARARWGNRGGDEAASAGGGDSSYGGYELKTPDNPPGEEDKRRPDSIAAAREWREQVAAIEPVITRDIIDIAGAHGAQMEGLDYRLKSEKSLARKVDAERDDPDNGGDPVKAAESMSDVARYTMTFKDTQYVHGSKNVIRDLEDKGYTVRVKNYWAPGDPYQGINIAAVHPETGVKFELQLHTPTSLDFKEPRLSADDPMRSQATHVLYERYRESGDMRVRVSAYRSMQRQASQIPVPPPPDALLNIGEVKFQPLMTPSGEVVPI